MTGQHPPAIGTTFQSILGAVICGLRSSDGRNITQTDIANQLDITVSTWSRIERGESALTVDQLAKIADFLEVPLSKLFEFVEEKINQLNEQGVQIAISKSTLAKDDILQLSSSQLAGFAKIHVGVGIIGGAAGAAYSIYKLLKKK